LDAYRASALTHYEEQQAVKMKVTAEDIKSALLGMAFGQETFISYFRKHNANSPIRKRIRIEKKYMKKDIFIDI